MVVQTGSVDLAAAARHHRHQPAHVVPAPAAAPLRRAVDRPAWLAGLVILLLAVPVAETGESPAIAHVRPADLAAATLVLLVARLVATGRLDVRIRTPLVAIAAAMVLAGGLSVFTAENQIGALAGWARFTEIFVLVPIAVALSIRSRWDVLWIIVPLVTLGVLEGGLGLHQHLTGTGASYGATNTRAIGTFGAYEIMGLATVVGCTIIVLSAVAVVAKGAARWLASAGAVGLLAPLAFSYSRGAWIGTAAGLVVVVLSGGLRRGIVIICIAGLALVAVSPTLSETNPLVQRISSITSSVNRPDTSVSDRYGLWTAAGAMWRDHPVTGVGIKNFPRHRDRYAPVSVSSASDIADPGSGFRRVELLSPHNLYLLVLSEQGLAGALAGAAALATLIVAGARRLRRR
jgi:O-antigen ligase